MRKVVLIGLGAAARSIHLPALRATAAFEVVGGFDPDPAARAWFVDAVAGARCPEELNDLWQGTRDHWAVIATPPATHRDVALQALHAGLHVFCEKPFGRDPAEAIEIVAAAEQAKRHLAVNYEFSWMPILAIFDQPAVRAEIGELLFAQVWQTANEVDPVPGWRGERRTLREFGSHPIEYLLRVFGGPPSRVTARMPRPTGIEGDLVDLVTLEWPAGRAASITLDRVSLGGHRYFELRVDGTCGSFRASVGGRAEGRFGLRAATRRPFFETRFARGGLAWIERGAKRRVVAKNPGAIFADATARHLTALASALDQGREVPVSGARAALVAKIVARAYESAEAGRTLDFWPGSPSQ